jgi:hypothetical protein
VDIDLLMVPQSGIPGLRYCIKRAFIEDDDTGRGVAREYGVAPTCLGQC